MLDIWLAAAEGTLLGFGAQRVIALRAMKIVAGGSSARSELSRMMTEKVSATAGAEGRCPGSTASKVYGFWAGSSPETVHQFGGEAGTTLPRACETRPVQRKPTNPPSAS